MTHHVGAGKPHSRAADRRICDGDRRHRAHRLATLARQDGIDIGDPLILARTGWTTADLQRALDLTKPAGPFDLVTLMIGVNNQFQHRPPDEYRTQLADLLQRAITLAGGKPTHVVVLSIPDWVQTPFGKQAGDTTAIARDIDAFNAICNDETAKAGAKWVDVTPISRTVTTQPALVAGDGLHPSAEQYAKWAAATVPIAEAATE